MHEHHKHHHHTKGCNTYSCDVRVGRAWAKKHPPKTVATPFDLCVANREAGTGTVATQSNARFYTINWHLDEDGIHTGGFQWDHATWGEGGGYRYATEAYEATPSEQLKVFHHFYPGHESRWAQTAPYC